MTNAPENKAVMALDSYEDLAKGFMQPGVDSSLTSQIGSTPLLQDATLANLWRGDGLAKTIIKTPIDDAVRPWFDIQGTDTPELLIQEMTRLKAKKAIQEMGYWTRLYGGAICCIGYADNAKTVTEPILGQNTPINFLKVYPRSALEPMETMIDDNPKSSRYGLPFEYRVQTSNGTVAWHWSRVIEMKGEPLPDDNWSTADASNDARYWGISCLQGLTERLKDLGISLQGVAALLKEASVGKYTLHGLATALAGGKADLIAKRLTTMNAAKGILNAVVLDAGGPGVVSGAIMPAETYTRESVSFSGVPEVIELIEGIISGTSGIPETKLYGRQSKGLGGTDEASQQDYFAMVGDTQEMVVNDAALDLTQRVNAYIKAVPETELAITWNNAWEPSLEQEIKMRKEQAETDKLKIDSGILDPEEVREARHTGDTSPFAVIQVEKGTSSTPRKVAPTPTEKVEKTPRTATKAKA